MKRYLTNIEAHNEVMSLLKRNFTVENNNLIERLNRMKQLDIKNNLK
tara:strand:- start:186 stop:326 length:141 start_codon:yes stop_codon:yes gene_type:complete